MNIYIATYRNHHAVAVAVADSEGEATELLAAFYPADDMTGISTHPMPRHPAFVSGCALMPNIALTELTDEEINALAIH